MEMYIECMETKLISFTNIRKVPFPEWNHRRANNDTGKG